MAPVTLRRIGGIALSDLTDFCALRGFDTIPYPLFLPPKAHDGTAIMRDRLSDVNLAVFQRWIDSYTRADIWVECQVHQQDRPAVRIAACRAGEEGFFATQQPGDVVDVFSLSAYEIGAAIAASCGLTTPGKRPSIVAPPFFPGLVRNGATHDPGDNHGVSFHAVTGECDIPAVAGTEVTAMAVIQSRCAPTSEWGINPNAKAVGWVRVAGDGEYIYAPDFFHATPVTPQSLRERIDQLIAEDVAVLRHQRAHG